MYLASEEQEKFLPELRRMFLAGNFTKENSFKDGAVIIGAPMFNNQTMDKGKFKFKLKEEKSGRLRNYGPFFRFVLSFE